MPGSPGTQPAPELPRERRLALVIATASYDDESLRRLRAPARDADDLRTVLADPEVGAFTVTSVLDGTAQSVRIAVADFVADLRPDDLVLVYLSCHGLVDLRRRLYFAARDTRKERLSATGVEAQWILDQLEDCRARRQVLVLDCCFSGAFAAGAKGDEGLGLGERFLGQGRGRVVLTASRDSEYSFEGEPVAGTDAGSVFTSALVEGLRSGAADLDHDGYVSVDDAYGYAYEQVASAGAHQTPQRWLYGAEGAILLARSPAGVSVTPAELPEGIARSLDSSYVPVRAGAVDALAEWLDDDDPARVLAARETLTRVVETDRPEVADRAREHLAAHGGDAAARGSPGVRHRARRLSTAGGAAAPPAVGAGRPSNRIRYAAAGAVLVAGVAAGGVVWRLQGDADPPSGTADSPSSGAGVGSYTASGPWRIEIHDNIGANDTGCDVALTRNGAPDPEREWKGVYGVYSYQIPRSGSFSWTVNDPGCLVIPRATSGNAELPATFPAYRGDTDAFQGAPSLTAEVRRWAQGERECELTLKDPADSGLTSAVDIRTVTPEQPRTSLDVAGRDRVYLSDLSCEVHVSD